MTLPNRVMTSITVDDDDLPRPRDDDYIVIKPARDRRGVTIRVARRDALRESELRRDRERQLRTALHSIKLALILYRIAESDNLDTTSQSHPTDSTPEIVP